jgi:hypothetical protein
MARKPGRLPDAQHGYFLGNYLAFDVPFQTGTSSLRGIVTGVAWAVVVSVFAWAAVRWSEISAEEAPVSGRP